jgi:glutamine synthetase
MDYSKSRNFLIDTFESSLSSIQAQLNNTSIHFLASCELEFYLIPEDFRSELCKKDKIKEFALENHSLPRNSYEYSKYKYNDEKITQVSNYIKDKLSKEHNIKISDFDREDGFNQFEIQFEKYHDIVSLCDNIVIAKKNISQLVKDFGFDIIYITKPFADQPGNSMHIHLSIFDGYDNLFAKDTNLMKNCIFKILSHAKEMTYISCPSKNCYERLILPKDNQLHRHYPVNASWGFNNRTCLIRVPQKTGLSPDEARFEYRLPSSISNPYLTFSSLLYPIFLSDVETKNIEPIYGNSFDNQYEKLERLPRNIDIAKDAFRASKLHEFMKDISDLDICTF